jgi:hypothetical protein
MALTPEEQRELESLELKELEAKALAAEQRKAAARETEQPEVEDPTWRDRLRAVQRGQLMGWGDEATAAVAATIAKGMTLLPGEQVGEDAAWGDIYDDIVGVEREEFQRYADDHAGEALGLEMVGGLLTPGRGIGRLPKSAGKGQRFIRETARNAIEGAIGGAGVSDEDRLSGAGWGAAGGTVLGGALSGAGALPRAFANRRVRTKLGDKPLHMAVSPDATGKQGVIADMWRRGVGGSFGGRQALKDQERPFVAAAEDAVDTAKTRLASVTEDVNLRRDNELDDLAIAGATRRSEVGQTWADKIDDVTQTARVQAEQVKAKPPAVRAAEARQLQGQAVDAAIPERMGDKARAAVKGADPQGAVRQLNDWWKTNGFSTVKKNNFSWNDGELIGTLKAVIKEDPALMLTISQVPGMTKGMVKKLLNLKKGQTPEMLTGEQLVAIRNVFAMASNNTSKKFEAGALRRVANEFDDFIRARLGPDDLAGFNDDLARYGPVKQLQKAVTKARRKDGFFDTEDWLAALPASQVSEGRGLLQMPAQAARSRISAADAAARQVLKAGGELPQETRTLTKALRRRRDRVLREESAALRKQRREIRNKARTNQRLVQARAARDEAKAQMADIKARAVPETSYPSQMVTTTAMGGLLGSVFGGLPGGAVGLLAGAGLGTGVGRLAATKRAQQLVSGQSPWQRKVRVGLRNARQPRGYYGGDSLADMANRLRRSGQGTTLRYNQDEDY